MDWLIEKLDDLWYYHPGWVIAALGVLAAALLIAGVWWFGIERLPGYNTDPALTTSYIEPGGATSTYATGIVVSTELSIKGPKMTIASDVTQQQITFFVPETAPVWLGLIIGDKTITGRERVTFADIKKGQRVAIYIGPVNQARRVNILKR
jgi:hypothetical protein